MSDFNPHGVFAVLNRHEVRYVVIGGIAGTLLGSSVMTNDTDICYSRSRENLRRLVSALTEMNARLRGVPADLPFILDERTFQNGDSFTFETIHGAFDCLGTPSGSKGYDDLAARATTSHIDGVGDVQVVSIDDLIRMKRAAGRPKDLFAVEHLEVLKQIIDDVAE